MPLAPCFPSICSVCLVRSTDNDDQAAPLALVMRLLLDKAGLRKQHKMSDAEVVADPSRYFTASRREAAALLLALGKLGRPPESDPPF